MHTPFTRRYPMDEIARRGAAVYREVVLPRLTPADQDKYVVIDIETGEYEIDAGLMEASLRLHARIPGAQGWAERVGHPGVVRMRSPRRRPA